MSILARRKAPVMVDSSEPNGLSPGVYRFHFFSREELRAHVHVHAPHGEAKYWLDPEVSLAQNRGLTARQLSMVRRIIAEREDEIRRAWQAHFCD